MKWWRKDTVDRKHLQVVTDTDGAPYRSLYEQQERPPLTIKEKAIELADKKRAYEEANKEAGIAAAKVLVPLLIKQIEEEILERASRGDLDGCINVSRFANDNPKMRKHKYFDAEAVLFGLKNHFSIEGVDISTSSSSDFWIHWLVKRG
jgi:hypothetical protein